MNEMWSEALAARVAWMDTVHPAGYPATEEGIYLGIMTGAQQELLTETLDAWRAARCKCKEPRCDHHRWGPVADELLDAVAVLMRVWRSVAGHQGVSGTYLAAMIASTGRLESDTVRLTRDGIYYHVVFAAEEKLKRRAVDAWRERNWPVVCMEILEACAPLILLWQGIVQREERRRRAIAGEQLRLGEGA